MPSVASSSGPQLLYYRVYNKDGAIATKRPAYLDDIYIGHIKSEWVALPSNAGSLRLCLSVMENIDPDKTTLFISPYSKTATADNVPITFYSNQTPGIVPEEPLLLLSQVPPKDGMKPGTESFHVPPDSRSSLEPLFLYYGVYTKSGASTSKAPVDPEKPWISRINLDLMPPPPSVATLRRLIAAKEAITGSSQLFADKNSMTPLSDDDRIVADDGQWLGSTPDDHVSFKFTTQPSIPTPPSIPTRPNIPTFVEGAQYRILNRSTERALILNNGVVSGRDLYLFDPKVNDAGTTATYQGRYLEFTLKRRDDGGVALRSARTGQWASANFMNSATEQSLFLISSKSNKDFFFICADPGHRLAFFDTRGSDITGYGAFRVESGNFNMDDTTQMWRLFPV